MIGSEKGPSCGIAVNDAEAAPETRFILLWLRDNAPRLCEFLVVGVGSLEMKSNSAGNLENNTSSIRMSCPPHPLATKLYRHDGNLPTAHPSSTRHVAKTASSQSGSMVVLKHSYKTPDKFVMQRDGNDNRSDGEGKKRFQGSDVGSYEKEDNPQNQLVRSKMNGPADDANIFKSMVCVESDNVASLPTNGTVDLLNVQLQAKSGTSYCPSPQGNFYSATQYTEAKQSFTNTDVSECTSSMGKSGGSGEVNNSCDLVESRKTSIHRGSTGSDVSNESSSSGFSSAMYKPHKSNDIKWEAIQAVRLRNHGALELKNFRILKRLGRGDIGTVHLAELIGTRTFFAVRVMDKEALVSRKKIVRAQTQREILQSLDHPFLPTLYTHFETETMSFLVMEFCPGGDLHSLRQKQPGKFFPEHAARFYLAEVLLALEYLHMLGIIYKDLKPENVLVREDGHIMLSDFDLSLRCAVRPTLVKSSNVHAESNSSGYCIQPACVQPSCAIQPACIQPTCFGPLFLSKPKKEKISKQKTEVYSQVIPLPELIAEPTNA